MPLLTIHYNGVFTLTFIIESVSCNGLISILISLYFLDDKDANFSPHDSMLLMTLRGSMYNINYSIKGLHEKKLFTAMHEKMISLA